MLISVENKLQDVIEHCYDAAVTCFLRTKSAVSIHILSDYLPQRKSRTVKVASVLAKILDNGQFG